MRKWFNKLKIRFSKSPTTALETATPTPVLETKPTPALLPTLAPTPISEKEEYFLIKNIPNDFTTLNDKNIWSKKLDNNEILVRVKDIKKVTTALQIISSPFPLSNPTKLFEKKRKEIADNIKQYPVIPSCKLIKIMILPWHIQQLEANNIWHCISFDGETLFQKSNLSKVVKLLGITLTKYLKKNNVYNVKYRFTKRYLLNGFSSEQIKKIVTEFPTVAKIEDNSLLIDSILLDKALKTINAVADNGHSETTDEDEFIQKIDWFCSTQYSETIPNNETAFLTVANNVIARNIKKQILIHYRPLSHQQPIYDDNIHIWLYSAIRGQANRTPPSCLWDIPVDCRKNGFYETGYGIPIRDFRRGWTAAEVVRNNIYVYHNIVANGTQDEIRLFEEILTLSLPHLCLDTETKKEMSSNDYEITQELYVSKAIREYHNGIEKANNTLRNFPDTAFESRANLINQYADQRKKQMQLLACQEEKNEIRKKALITLSEFKKHHEVKEISINYDGCFSLKIMTNPITAIDPSTEKELVLGEFSIEIHNNTVLCTNLTQRKSSFLSNCHHAATVIDKCLICTEEDAMTFSELFAEYDYLKIFELALQIIHNGSPEYQKRFMKIWA